MAGAQSAWGVDIGVSSLKAIKLHREGDRVAVEAFEVIEHEKFLTEAESERDSLVRGTLQKFLTKNSARRERVYISVPGSSTFARFVKLPPVETKKIPEIVRFEAIQQIPFPLDQVNWDYQTFQQPDSPDVEVGIFAMKKELVAQVMSNFEAQGMTVEGVQMSPLAVYNAAAYDRMDDGKGTILIDMGAEHTDLVVMDQGRLWLRTINIGGNHFTDALAKSFKRSFAQAEQLKRTAATSKYQKQIYQAMRPIFTDLTAEIQRSIGFYNSTHRDSRLERIVGMGNPFKLPNLQKYLQQELKLDVQRLENFNATVDNAAALNENILSMTAAYGLALQALGLAAIDTNLLPVEIARKMMWRNKRPWFIGATALLALGTAGLVGQWYTQKSAFAAQEAVKGEQNTSAIALAQHWMDEDRKIPNTFDNDLQTANSQLALAGNRSAWPYLTNDIFYAVPQNPANRQQGQVVITGVEAAYFGSLSDHSLDEQAGTSAAMGGGAAPMPAPGGGGTPLGPTSSMMPNSFMQPQQVVPQAAPVMMPPAITAAAATAPALGPGESNRGFIVTVYGYTPTVTGRPKYEMAAAYHLTLIGRAPKKAKPEDYKAQPYYFVPGDPKESQLSGGATSRITGAAMGGGGAVVVQGNMPMPWGNVKGPYWDLFVPDMLGIKLPEPGAMGPGGGYGPMGGGLGGSNDQIQGPVDIYSTTMTHPLHVQYMDDPPHYLFTLRFKVHLIQPKN